MAGELVKRGHEVHIFATEIEDDSAAYQVHLIPVWRFPRTMRTLSFLRNSALAVGRRDYDIIHGVAPIRAINVYNPHGGVEQAYLRQEFRSISKKPYYLYRLLRRYLSPRHYLEVLSQKQLYKKGNVKKTIAISRMVKQDLISYYAVDERDIAVVFNSVDLERFRPENRDLYRERKREELGIGESEVVLLFAGNNFRLKGLEPLIRALALLKQGLPGRALRLLVAGRGQRGRYQRLARELGVSDTISFLGPVTGMEHYYAASDVYVHPTFYDSCSLTVLEALASGLPVVTSRFNGAAEAIQSDEAGTVIDDPADAEELARAIAPYIDEDRRARARVGARAGMEQYPPERNIAETLAVYQQVAGEDKNVGTRAV